MGLAQHTRCDKWSELTGDGLGECWRHVKKRLDRVVLREERCVEKVPLLGCRHGYRDDLPRRQCALCPPERKLVDEVIAVTVGGFGIERERFVRVELHAVALPDDRHLGTVCDPPDHLWQPVHRGGGEPDRSEVVGAGPVAIGRVEEQFGGVEACVVERRHLVLLVRTPVSDPKRAVTEVGGDVEQDDVEHRGAQPSQILVGRVLDEGEQGHEVELEVDVGMPLTEPVSSSFVDPLVDPGKGTCGMLCAGEAGDAEHPIWQGKAAKVFIDGEDDAVVLGPEPLAVDNTGGQRVVVAIPRSGDRVLDAAGHRGR